jgi:hypothetical protein
MAVDKKLTWRLVGPHSKGLFSAHLDDPPDPWVSPEYLQYTDWPVEQTWRKALIDASGLKPRNFELIMIYTLLRTDCGSLWSR